MKISIKNTYKIDKVHSVNFKHNFTNNYFNKTSLKIQRNIFISSPSFNCHQKTLLELLSPITTVTFKTFDASIQENGRHVQNLL